MRELGYVQGIVEKKNTIPVLSNLLIESIGEGTTLPGHLPSLVEAISPSVKATAGKPGNPLDNAIRQNVLLNVEKLKTVTPIIETFVSEKKVQVIGAVYHLENGHVELLS